MGCEVVSSVGNAPRSPLGMVVHMVMIVIMPVAVFM